MARLYLVRHGKAAAGWGEDLDPGLDELGHSQAQAVAKWLAPRGPLPIVVSPLRRTRETAATLEQLWRIPGRIEPRVGEIPSPTPDLASRTEWLKEAMQGRWPQLGAATRAWRRDVLDALAELTTDTVVVSHFVAINAAVGHALGDDRVISFRPDNGSCTVLDVSAGVFKVLELGAEGATRVL